MKRPTIDDLAQAAGVSKSTVNRILSGNYAVRQATIDRVIDAAELIGFYGIGALRSRSDARKTVYRLGFLLLQSNRVFYQNIKHQLEQAQKEFDDHRVQLQIEFLDDSAPQVIAARMMAMADQVDAIAVVTSQYPEIARSIDLITEKNKPVFGLVSPISGSDQVVGYVGLDNWKVGRSAAWMIDKWGLNSENKDVALFLGNPRFRCQDLNESGFRSYFREHDSQLNILEPISTYESADVAHDQTIELFTNNKNVAAVYVAGGGVSGVLRALEELNLANPPFVVGYQITDSTLRGLMNGTLSVAISHPLPLLVDSAIENMVAAIENHSNAGAINIRIPFDICFSENI